MKLSCISFLSIRRLHFRATLMRGSLHPFIFIYFILRCCLCPILCGWQHQGMSNTGSPCISANLVIQIQGYFVYSSIKWCCIMHGDFFTDTIIDIIKINHSIKKFLLDIFKYEIFGNNFQSMSLT